METIDQKIQEFFSHSTQTKFKKGERILRENQTPGGVFFLKSGVVRSYFISEEGNELTLIMSEEGAIFPLRWALAELENIYNYQALSDTVLLRTSQANFQDFVRKNPDVLARISQQLIMDYNALAYRMQHIVFGNAYAKIASVVLTAAKRFGSHSSQDNQEVEIKLSLTHQQIADTAGVTRETASLEMKRLKDNGLIDYAGKTIRVLDLKKLSQLAYL